MAHGTAKAGFTFLLALASCSAFSPNVGESTLCDSPPCGTAVVPQDSDDGGTAEGDGGQAGVSFARDIRPLMDRTATNPSGPGCRDCHYPSSPDPKGFAARKLDLSSLGALRKGGTTTRTNIVIPGDPEGSLIVKALRGRYALARRMPQSGPPYWTDAEIQLMADWIAQGAKGEDSE